MNNFTLKTISFALGYLVWALISTNQLVETTITIPVVTYDSLITTESSAPLNFTSPEKISVRVQAQRKQLTRLLSKLAVHIDKSNFKPGDNNFIITPELLFLPDTAKLVHSLPESIIIHVTESNA
ncbi:hypothetical protein EBU24_01610 [bacterium]|nr:hypothetical protein [bacterium]